MSSDTRNVVDADAVPSRSELLESIADSVPAALVYLGPDERFLFANRYYCERYGRPEDLLGRKAREVLGDEQYARLAPHLQRARSGEVARFETAVLRLNGPPLWASIAYVPDFGPDGRVRGIAVFSEDISDRRAAEQGKDQQLAAEHRAREHLTRMQQVMAGLSRARTMSEVMEVTCRLGAEAIQARSGAIWMADDRGALVLVRYWGVPSSYVETYRVLEPDDDRFPAVHVMRTGEPMWVDDEDDYRRVVPAIYEAARRAGRLAAFAALPLVFDGRPRGVIVFSKSFTHEHDPDERSFYESVAQYCSQALERARLLDEARAAKEAAEEASRVKDEFLAMLGHELRNPLAPIVSAVQIMNAEPSDAFVRERRVIERQVRHLARLVDDLLDVARVARGRITLDLSRVRMSDVVERAVEMARPLLEERRHVLRVDVPSGLSVIGDATRLAQVVSNLLNNAARYTPPGGHVSVVARHEGDQIVLRVCDDGNGIAPDLLPRVFDLFAQSPQAPDRPNGGLGLGLAIVKNLVALHGGWVEARSEGAHRGVEMIVRLPAEPGVPHAEPGARTEPAREAQPREVLVVDDNDDAAEMLAVGLKQRGFSVRVAGDGPSALALVSESRPPDVAVLDIGLPEMDGYELAQRMRVAAPGAPLVALTGYGRNVDRAKARAAGFVEHLVKPVDLDALARVLGRLTHA